MIALRRASGRRGLRWSVESWSVEKKAQAGTLPAPRAETKMCTGCERGVVDSYVETERLRKRMRKEEEKLCNT